MEDSIQRNEESIMQIKGTNRDSIDKPSYLKKYTIPVGNPKNNGNNIFNNQTEPRTKSSIDYNRPKENTLRDAKAKSVMSRANGSDADLRNQAVGSG